MKKPLLLGQYGFDYNRGVDEKHINSIVVDHRIWFANQAMNDTNNTAMESLGTLVLETPNKPDVYVLHALYFDGYGTTCEILTEITEDEFCNIAIMAYKLDRKTLFINGKLVDSK